LGTQQSGVLDLKVADISKDQQLVVYARTIAQNLIQDDAGISKEENFPIRRKISKILKSKPNWGQIS